MSSSLSHFNFPCPDAVAVKSHLQEQLKAKVVTLPPPGPVPVEAGIALQARVDVSLLIIADEVLVVFGVPVLSTAFFR